MSYVAVKTHLEYPQRMLAKYQIFTQTTLAVGVPFSSSNHNNFLYLRQSMCPYFRLLFVSTLDGRLSALDIANGTLQWSVPTNPGPMLSSSIHNYEVKIVLENICESKDPKLSLYRWHTTLNQFV